jgi:hypothetical protein
MKRISIYTIVFVLTIIIISVLSFAFEYLIYKYRLAGVLSEHVRNSFFYIFILNGSILLLSLPLYLYLTYRYNLRFNKKLFILYAEICAIIIALVYGTFAGGFDFSSVYTYYRLLVSFLLAFFFVSLERYFVTRKDVELF